MTRFWIKLISLLCALMMIMSAAVACAEQNEDEKTPDDSTQEGETGDNQSGDKDSDEIVYTAKIPDGYSCNGETFTVYTYPQDVFVWKDYDWQ